LALHFHRFFLRLFSMTMKSKTGIGFTRAGCLALLAIMGLLRPAFAVDTNAAPAADAEIGVQDLLRSSLQIQEQLYATQLAIKTNRQEAAAAAARNSLLLDERLQLMEKTLANERLEQLNAIGRSQRTIFMVAGLAVLGFLVLLVVSFLQWTAVNRLATAAAHSTYVLGMGEAHLPPARASELAQSNTRFLGLMERLEQRIHGLEASVKLPKTLSESSSANDESNGPATALSPAKIPPHTAPDKANEISLLFSKSQTLLKLDKAEAALGCLDEVLTLDPGNADALVKKGAALERLQLLDQAIQCYDHAIAQDNSMTMAYLYKGGILNRLERQSEALACYEQALQLGKTATPQTSSSNNPHSGAPSERRHLLEETSQNLAGSKTKGNA
jgi:tetratricopeptide (TPR) repeat protein